MSEPKLLDLFCGMGGWSIGFYREGFECTGIDIVDVGYPYRLMLQDIMLLDANLLDNYDVIVSSPPCTEFSWLTRVSIAKGQRGPQDPEKGLKLVRRTKEIIDMLKPRFWILENVYGSIPYITPILGKPSLVAKPWVLWGNFPQVLFAFEPQRRGDIKLSHTFEHIGKGGDVMAGGAGSAFRLGKDGNRIGLPEDFAFDPLRSWKRARIPVFLSQYMAKSIKQILAPKEFQAEQGYLMEE